MPLAFVLPSNYSYSLIREAIFSSVDEKERSELHLIFPQRTLW